MDQKEPSIEAGRRLTVLLIHGLSRTPLSMWSLSRSLRGRGFVTESFGYVAFLESYDRIIGRLRQRLATIAGRGPYAVVGHSLGGVLVRAALDKPDFPLPAHVIMLGTPNNRSRMAEWAARRTPWGLVVGQAGRKLAEPDFFENLPIPPVPYTVVAGTKGAPIAPGPFRGEANDTLVAVSETKLGIGERHVTVPVGHTFMMNKASVLALILESLEGLGSERTDGSAGV